MKPAISARAASRLLVCAAVWSMVPVVVDAQAPAPRIQADRYFDASAGLTIEGLVSLAIERAPSLAAARARVDAATGERTQASLRPNPKALFERRERSGGIDNQTMIGLAWPLDLFRRGARVEVADHAVRTAALVKDDEVREQAAIVRERAAAVLAALRQLDVASSWARFARTRLELLTARVDSGASRPLDRDMADVEWRRAEADVLMWQARVDGDLAALKAAVGLGAAASLPLAEPLESVAVTLPALTIPTVGEAALARTDVLALESVAREAAAEGVLASRDARLDLSISAAYVNRRIGLPAGSDRMHEFMVGVTVDLPWRNRQQGRIAAADGRRRAAEESMAARRLDAEAEIDAARIRERAAQATLGLYRDGLIETADRNLSVVRESFELGRGTLLDVITEERRYLDLQTAFTAALREVIDARTALLRALGVAS